MVASPAIAVAPSVNLGRDGPELLGRRPVTHPGARRQPHVGRDPQLPRQSPAKASAAPLTQHPISRKLTLLNKKGTRPKA